MWHLVLLMLSGVPTGELLSRAQDRERAGDDRAAMALLEEGVAADPAWAMGHVELGRLVLKSGSQAPLAEFHLDVARSLSPENPRVHYLYALAVLEQGRAAEARRALELALSLRDDFPDAWFRLAGLLFAQGEWASAVTAYQHFLRAQPQDTGARLQLAAALEKTGAVKDAEATLRGMLSGAAHTLVARRLAELLDRQGRTVEAQRVRASVEQAPPRRRELKPSRR